MITCAECNTRNTNGAEMCITCGNALSGATIATAVSTEHRPDMSARESQPEVEPGAASTLDESRPRTYPCPYCGIAAAADADFCPRCGKRLQGPECASFLRRFGGYLIDGIVLFIIAGIPAAIVSAIIISSAPDIAFTQEQLDQQNEANFNSTLWSSIISFVISFSYVVLLNANGGTWGKRILGMRLEDATSGENIGLGRAILRWFVAIGSVFALAIGYLWALWDENNQTWHDKAAGSAVVRE